MALRDVLNRLRGWVPLAGLACLLASVVVLHRAAQSDVQREESAPAAAPAAVPMEQRYEGLEVSVVQGLRLRDALGCRRIEVGSFAIRKKAIGFVRVGAFNEAVIRGLRVVVDEPFLSRGGELLRDALRADPPARAGFSAARPSYTGLVNRVFGALWQYSPHRDQRLSGFVIQDLEFFVAVGERTDLCLFRCDSAVPDVSSGHARVRLRGNVDFENKRGESLRCAEALIELAETPLVHARGATVRSPQGTHRYERVSFPLISLLQDAGFPRSTKEMP